MLLPADLIGRRVRELAEEIDRHYSAAHGAGVAGSEITLVVVLRGAFVFAADIIRRLKTPAIIDFIRLKSYGNDTESSGEVQITADLCDSVRGRRVLIVEDIVDTGLTMRALVNLLRERGAADVKICTLLDKPSGRQVEMEPDFAGFVVPDVFVVGYGIDCGQRHRCLPDVCVVGNNQDQRARVEE